MMKKEKLSPTSQIDQYKSCRNPGTDTIGFNNQKKCWSGIFQAFLEMPKEKSIWINKLIK